MSNTTKQPSSTSGKPERRMLDVKELITGFLGIAIVIFTLAMTGLSFSMAGEEAQMQDAMRVLTLLFGLSGVVVGYYFGRVPAEKRADTAHVAMDQAIQEKTRIIKQADKVHNDMQRGMDRAGLDPGMLQSSDLTLNNVTPEQWEQIKEILAQVDTGISGMTENLPSSARSS